MPKHYYPDLSRRRWLTLTGSAFALGATRMSTALGESGEPSVGIALGAGGANGLAHIPVLEALDAMNVRPQRIAGASIGAVIGALYASGMSGREIRQLVRDFFVNSNQRIARGLLSDQARTWLDLIEVELGHGGLLSSEEFVSFLYDRIQVRTFDELSIPLAVSTADLWNREEVVFDSGPLLPAIQASMALPGIFEPVRHEGRVLIDGGTVNPVPFDLLARDCEIVIAVDVTGRRTPPEPGATGYFETIFNSVKVMQQAIVSAKRAAFQPRIFLVPEIVDVRALEFYRADEIFDMASAAAAALEKELGGIVSAGIANQSSFGASSGYSTPLK